MGHPRWELAGRETGRGIYHRRWDIQDGPSKMGTGRQGDGKRNLPQEMGQGDGKRKLPQEMGHQDGNWQAGRREEEFATGGGTSKMGTGKRNLPQEMGLPRWELAGRETGRGIYHRRWDIQDGNWQVGRLAGREAGRETGREIYHRRWDIQDGTWQVGRQVGRREEELRWELAGRETGRGIYHMTWDFQDGNWQVGRREEEFTT